MGDVTSKDFFRKKWQKIRKSHSLAPWHLLERQKLIKQISGWIRDRELKITSQLFYHCATSTGQMSGHLEDLGQAQDLASGGSTVVEQLTHDPKFAGSNPAVIVTERK